MTDDSLKKKAHDLLQKGRLDSALRAFEQLLKTDPGEASTYNSIGDVLLKMNRNEEAVTRFYSAADLYLQNGLNSVALSISRKTLRVNPQFHLAHFLIGRCFLAQENEDRADKSFLQFLRSKPDKRSQEFLDTLKALIDLEPENPKWVLQLAKLAYVMKNETLLDFCISIAAERNYPQHQRLVKMLEELRAEEEAILSELNGPVQVATILPEQTEEVDVETGVHDTLTDYQDETVELEEKYSGENKEFGEMIEETSEIDQEDYYEKEDYKETGKQPEYEDISEDEDKDEGGDEDEDEDEDKDEGGDEDEDEDFYSEETEEKPVEDEFEEAQLIDTVTFEATDFIDTTEETDQFPEKMRIGEYFVAEGLLHANDVLKALEIQAGREERKKLGDELVDMGLVSIRQVREALSKQVTDLKKRLENNPDDALGFVELGNILIDVGDFYGAVESYLKAANVYRNSNREGMVFELLEGVLDICPESLSAARELVRIRYSLGPEGQARALYRLAVAFLLNESRPEAIAALEAAVDAYPEADMASTLLEGIRPPSEDMEEYADIGSILADIDRMFESEAAKSLACLINEFKEGIAEAISPEDYSTHYDLGIAYMEMGLYREAISEFEQVLSCPEYRTGAREMLGRCYFMLERFDEAEEEFQKGMGLAREDHEAIVGFHVHLARVYAATGRTRQAAYEMQSAKKLDPVLAQMRDRLE